MGKLHHKFRLHSRVFVLAASLVGLAAPLPIIAQTAVEQLSPTDLNQSIDAVIRQESKKWWINSYDAGTVSNFKVTYSGPDGREFAARASFKYNGGLPGWIEMIVKDGHLVCVSYWDANDCHSVSAGGPSSATLIARGIISAALVGSSSAAGGDASISRRLASQPNARVDTNQ